MIEELLSQALFKLLWEHGENRSASILASGSSFRSHFGTHPNLLVKFYGAVCVQVLRERLPVPYIDVPPINQNLKNKSVQLTAVLSSQLTPHPSHNTLWTQFASSQ